MPQKRRSWKLSMNTMAPLTEKRAREIRSAGFNHVYLDDIFQDPRRRKINLRTLKSFPELTALSAHAPVLTETWEYNEPDLLKKISRIIDISADFKLKFVTFHPEPSFPGGGGRKKQEMDYQQPGPRKRYREAFPRVFKEAARYASRYGITLTIENMLPHPFGNYMIGPAEIISLIKDVGEPNVGACLDSGHAVLAGQPPEMFIKELGRLLKETHFQDTLWPEGTSAAGMDLHRPPGIGSIDWVKVMDALEEIGYPGVVNFELGLRPKDKGPAELYGVAYKNWRMLERLREMVS